MSRPDLLALTQADLARLANPGLLKRAIKELEEGSLTFQMLEVTGDVLIRWSDGVACLFPAGKALAQASCNCGAVTFCRHLVRSVLAYQRG